MPAKAKDGPKVYITSKGAKYVDANELFRSQRVRQFLKNMMELEKKSKASQQAALAAKNSDTQSSSTT